MKRNHSDRSLSSDATKKICYNPTESVFGQLKDTVKYRIIWYNEHHSNPLECYGVTLQSWRGIVDYLEWFHNLDECKKYIESLLHECLCVILIGDLSLGFQSLITEEQLLRRTHSVYIYREAQDRISHSEVNVTGWITDERVKGVYENISELCAKVSQQALILGRQNFVLAPELISEDKQNGAKRTTCVKPYSNDDYFYNFLDSLTEIEANPNSKDSFVKECRHLYAKEQSVIRVIEEFDKNYVPEQAIYWYTRNGFLYSLLNQALRQQNIEALMILHFFIRDLDRQLLEALEKENSEWTQEAYLYRGQQMSSSEIEDLKESYRNCFFYSFLSTTTNIEIARMFSGAGQIMKDQPIQPVIFHFDCSTIKRTRGVSNIRLLSNNTDEEEILFSPLYSFSVRSVYYDEDEKAWIVMCDMHGGETDLSLLLHQRLIKLDIVTRVLMQRSSPKETSTDDNCRIFTEGMKTLLHELVIPEANIVTLDENARVKENTKHSVTALFLLKGLRNFTADSLAHSPKITPDMLAALWDSLATMYKDRGDFQLALEYFKKAEAYDQNCISAVLSRKVNLAQVYKMMGNYAEAWSLYKNLSDEYFDTPDNDSYRVFYEIAADVPYAKSEKTLEIWYPNVLDYVKYVDDRCQEGSVDKSDFASALMEKYCSLGHAFWYLVHDKCRALLCYNRWKELVEESHEPLGECFMHLAHTYFTDDPLKAKSLYEQAVVELSIAEERWPVELAICYSRLGCLQKRKQFFIRSFYLLTYVADLSTLLRLQLEEVAECYLYLAMSWDVTNQIITKTVAQQFSEQALRLFLNVKPPTSNFREMLECVEILLNLEGKINEPPDSRAVQKNEWLQKKYDEPPVTELQLKTMLEEALESLSSADLGELTMLEETIIESTE